MKIRKYAAIIGSNAVCLLISVIEAARNHNFLKFISSESIQ